MSDWYGQFYLTAGLWLVTSAIFTGLAIRYSPGHYLVKVAAITAIVGVSVWMPYTVNSMLGEPVDTTLEKLPNDFVLMGLDEQDKRVFLWLKYNDDAPEKNLSLIFPEGKKGQSARDAFRGAARMLKDQHGVRMRRGGGNSGKEGRDHSGNPGKGDIGDPNEISDADNASADGGYGDFHIDRRYQAPAKGATD
jgi:hypothetical protein